MGLKKPFSGSNKPLQLGISVLGRATKERMSAA